ncbi:hypothetical protein LTR66_010213 [Elasticomyces elasticus]|nr:hypothetical protein LTR66_010213 [Elasticomyces elasticus]
MSSGERSEYIVKLRVPPERLSAYLRTRQPAATPIPTSTAPTTPKLKLNLSARPPPQPSSSAVESPPSTKISFKNKFKAYPNAVNKTPKKRAADPTSSDAPPAKRQANAATAPSVADILAPQRKVSIKLSTDSIKSGLARPKLKLNSSVAVAATLTTSTPKSSKSINLKVKGRPPIRPIGVGYDSDASDIEEDPQIEHQFILRMLPGSDCDYLRTAIGERKLGIPVRGGGADVSIRFLDKEGHRATIIVRGNIYAAALVDLPCIIEGMKSWDKKGWWKVADICQMLLVLGPVHSEEDAKNAPLPREVNQKNYQYAHGLTPPMHWVRKRRFRKRMAAMPKEVVDEDVEKLLKDDTACELGGGTVEWRMEDECLGVTFDEDQDAEGEDDEVQDYVETVENGAFGVTPEEEELSEDEMLRMMQDELGGEGGQDADIVNGDEKIGTVHVSQSAIDNADVSAVSFTDSPAALAETPDAMMTDIETPAGQSTGLTDSDSEESDYDADDEPVDEATLTRQAEREQIMANIAEREQMIEAQRIKVAAAVNRIHRVRGEQTLQTLLNELETLRRNAGIEDDE